ncbi:MAG TPA: hypothetical protein G4O01_05300 [Dehalococcoidia bacterium]|jgi:hypothetical protein|nr:hypothetical protein [Dehalococcoidia bacterium]
MDTFYSVAPSVIFALGAINLASGLLIFFSCRCLAGSKIGARLMRYHSYQSFYQYHCYIWRAFWASVIIHASLALVVFWPG